MIIITGMYLHESYLWNTDWFFAITYIYPDSKVHGANMGPTWGRQDPGGPHVGPMNFAIWVHWLSVDSYQTEE